MEAESISQKNVLFLRKGGVLNPESVSVTPLTALGCALLGFVWLNA